MLNSKVWLIISLLLAIILYQRYQATTPYTSITKALPQTQSQSSSQSNKLNKSTLWTDKFSLQPQVTTGSPIPTNTLAGQHSKAQEPQIANLDIDKASNDSTIKACPFAEFTEQEEQRLNQQLMAFFNENYASDDIEQRKLGYIFSADSTASNQYKRLFFSDYLEDHPNDSIAVHQLLKVCLQLPNDKGCGRQLDSFIAQSDNDNGYLWLQLATNELVQQRPNQFLHYFEIAASKSRFDNYYFDYINLFLTASIGRIDNTYTQLKNTADELASAQLSNLGYIVDFCTGNIDNYQDSCRQLAQSLDNHSTNVDLQTFGASLLKEIYRKQGDNEALAKQTALDQQRYDALYNQDWVNAQSLMQYDQELMFTWLENGKLHGEHAAMIALLNEAKLKSLNPDYLPCPDQDNYNN